MLCFALGLWGCGTEGDGVKVLDSDDINPAKVIVRICDRLYSLAEFQEYLKMEMEDSQGEASDELLSYYLEKFIDHKALLGEAEKNNIRVSAKELDEEIKRINVDVSPEGKMEERTKNILASEGWKKQLREIMIVKKYVDLYLTSLVVVTNDEEQAYYNRYYKKQSRPVMYKLSQIIVRDKKAAEEIKSKLRGNVEKFSEFARIYSLSPDRKNGGDIGWFAISHLPEYLSKVVKKMRVGRVSDIIETDEDFILIKLENRKVQKKLSFYDLKSDIQNRLLQEKRERTLKEHLENIWHENITASAGINIFQENLNFIYRPLNYKTGAENENN